MTVALCLNCGEIKFGAFCPCHKCQSSSSGDKDIDLQFSDHSIGEEVLEKLGLVIKAINASCDDSNTRYWAFMYFVSTNQVCGLNVDLKDEMKMRVEEILSNISLPSI